MTIVNTRIVSLIIWTDYKYDPEATNVMLQLKRLCAIRFI